MFERGVVFVPQRCPIADHDSLDMATCRVQNGANPTRATLRRCAAASTSTSAIRVNSVRPLGVQRRTQRSLMRRGKDRAQARRHVGQVGRQATQSGVAHSVDHVFDDRMGELERSRADLVDAVPNRIHDRRRIAGVEGLGDIPGRILRRRDQVAHVDE
jgi:hypothetical protein